MRILLLLLACAKPPPPEPAAEPAEGSLAREALRPPPGLVDRLPEGGVLVRVVDPGQEPRELLQLHPSPGDVLTMRSVIDLEIAMGFSGRFLPRTAIPPMIMDMEVAVSAVDEDGTIHYSVEMLDVALGEDADAPPEVSGSMLADLEVLVGLTGQSALSPSGRLLRSDFQLPAGAGERAAAHIENMNRILDGLCAPLPEEPVGPGAKWESLSRVDTGNVAVAQRVLTELVARDGDRLSLATAISQEPVSWVIEVPEMPGVEVAISRFESGGGGRVELDLGALVPLRSSTRTETELQMTMQIGETEQITDQRIAMDIGVERL